MVSTNKVNISYSEHLNSMIEFVKNYLANCKTQKEVEEIQNGLLEFCYNYPDTFINEIHKKIGLKQKYSLKQKNNTTILNSFVNTLAQKDS